MIPKNFLIILLENHFWYKIPGLDNKKAMLSYKSARLRKIEDEAAPNFKQIEEVTEDNILSES